VFPDGELATRPPLPRIFHRRGEASMQIVRWMEHCTFAAGKMQKSNIFETERFFLDVYAFEPGQAQRPHTHSGNDKVYLVMEGTGRFLVGDEEADLGPGDAVLARAGVVHGAENRGPGRLVVLAFMAPHPEPKTQK
jgi:mannose-6-phosphate isomerase-like protein (cupin superfamily)